MGDRQQTGRRRQESGWLGPEVFKEKILDRKSARKGRRTVLDRLPFRVFERSFMAKEADRSNERELEQAEQTGARPKNPLPKQKQPKPGIEKKMEPRPQYKGPKYKGSGK